MYEPLSKHRPPNWPNRPTRGIRNNNPGNIERTGVRWVGMAADQSADDRFVVFKEARWGLRAIARVLLTYARHRRAADGSEIDTVREVVERWAPATENDADAYAAHLRQVAGLRAGEYLDLEDPAVLARVVRGIVLHENGYCPYPEELVVEAVALA